jgi:(heptosyl)LPS beta-1,4-glucosyltransferase
MQTTGQRISAVIVARNEEKRIGNALSSLAGWADEIVFFDMDSNDGTVAIAKQFGAKVFHIEQMGGQEPARPIAILKATGDWVVMLDADELISPIMRDRLLRVVQRDEADVVNMPRQNFLFGKAMTGAMMGANDDRQIRFFKNGHVEISPLLHAHPSVNPGSRFLQLTYPEDGAIVHFNYVNISHYLTKLDRYTGMEANKPKNLQSYSLMHAVLRAGYEFLNRFFRFGGYRDGWRGLYISLSMSFYRLTIWAKRLEQLEAGSAKDIEEIYAKVVRETLPAEQLKVE